MRIGIIAAGPRTSGGARLTAYLLLDNLDNTELIHAPKTYYSIWNPSEEKINEVISKKFDIIFIQKVNCENLVKRLKKTNTKVIYMTGDLLGHEMVKLCNHTIVSSEFLREQYKQKEKISVVMDYIEAPSNLIKQHIQQDKLNVLYYGTQNLNKNFEEELTKHSWLTLTKIGNPTWADIHWSLNTVYPDMLKFDVVVIYAELNRFNKCKSINRPLNPMVMEIPVICSPIPSYYQIIASGVNSDIVEDNSIDGFIECFKKYRYSMVRQDVGEKARKGIITKYTKECNLINYINIINKLQKKEV